MALPFYPKYHQGIMRIMLEVSKLLLSRHISAAALLLKSICNFACKFYHIVGSLSFRYLLFSSVVHLAIRQFLCSQVLEQVFSFQFVLNELILLAC